MAINRRDLLIASGGALTAAMAGRALAQEAQGQPLMGNPTLPLPPQQRMGWAVVGLGSFAVGQLMPAFGDANRSRLTALVSGNPEKLARLADTYGVEHTYSYDDYDSIVDNPDIDCVQIALPVGLHAEYTIRALEAGKHVLCEKPMASTSAECEAMIAAARKAGKVLGVGYRVHFEPTNQAALAMIRGEDIGPLRHIRAEHGFQADPENWPPHRWRLEKQLAGGGSMYDIGIYGINTSLMMLEGDAPMSISAVYAYPRDDARFREVEGGVDWRITMRSGAVVSGSSSYCYAPYHSKQTYIGAKSSLRMDPATTYYENALWHEHGGRETQIPAGAPYTQFAGQVDAFSEAARAGRPHATPGEMGYRDIRLIEMAYRSADQGGAPVSLEGI
ncbi:Gfo/Idh/MocA family oxidoreductase [Qipengyuania sp. GH1]|uniref:Gfo/Idh/MocA family protein n=1 Tax=Qipengyuania aestuarii TaxID=2867241 RepID=UPI001C88503D|nr:Gfo/Idh/MocA family oxidoreductase [Qipengyuania aestuarii]MBX7534978.1 Gfo/Idh/MocA family oxidoreductase [Qipengyuania aestuarii]